MVKSKQDYIDDERKQNKETMDASVAARKQQDERTIQQLHSTIDRQASLATKPYEEQIEELGVQARDAYDLSAIQEQVDRRQAEEAMASLGLTGSGLAHTQQQAAGVRRSKTDAGVQREVDRQSTALQSKIDQLLENAAIDKQEKADAIRTATAEWENAERDRIEKQSVATGTQRYDSAVQREFERVENQKQRDFIASENKKEQDAEAAQAEALGRGLASQSALAPYRDRLDRLEKSGANKGALAKEILQYDLPFDQEMQLVNTYGVQDEFYDFYIKLQEAYDRDEFMRRRLTGELRMFDSYDDYLDSVLA